MTRRSSKSATAIAARFIGGDIPRSRRSSGSSPTRSNFPIPLALVGDRAVVELFHGPTFAFKDVGARVMARLMAALQRWTCAVDHPGRDVRRHRQRRRPRVSRVDGIRVVVLFPDGAVTPVQEAQFTTLGGNVTAVAVAGTFDDCQRLAKEAFADQAIRRRARLTSANSINIGRLLPQTFYYAHAALRAAVPSCSRCRAATSATSRPG